MASKQQIDKYAAQSAFVFSGKVIKLKASTVDGLQTDTLAVVQIDHVVTAPAMFSALTGQKITVRFKTLSGIKQGSTMTFFTNGWIFGSSIAVDAVGYVEETGKQALASMVQASLTSNKDDILKTRLDSAETVVVGTVQKVEKSGNGTSHISEHDPDWHKATIELDEVIKGKKTTKQVSVLFPNSDDVRWHRIHKYQEGQQGIWIMQKGKKQDAKGIAPKAFAAIPSGDDVLTTLHPVDFLPLNELGRVKSILGK